MTSIGDGAFCYCVNLHKTSWWQQTKNEQPFPRAVQRRTYFHNVRFSPEEERVLQKRKEKYRYQTVSDFIRVARLIHLDWRMMEHNRVLADLKNQNKQKLDKLNEKQMWTNMQSLEVILESMVTTIIFIFVLLK